MIAQLVALSDVCEANSPLSVAKQCRMVRAQQGEPTKKPEAIASGFFVGSLCPTPINNIIINIHVLTTTELSEVGRRPSKTTECCFATGDCENKEYEALSVSEAPKCFIRLYFRE